MIRYTHTIEGITPERLQGFFEGWPNPPSPETHLRLLEHSDHVLLALDGDTGHVVGFVTAISDGVLSAYIPFLEVLPGHRGQGIGSELMRRMPDPLSGLYIVDLLCDAELQSFYAPLGMRPTTGMMVRNYERQSGQTLPASGHTG
jgi:ribosomal protein S18 acetylase RimI-like enzyme